MNTKWESILTSWHGRQRGASSRLSRLLGYKSRAICSGWLTGRNNPTKETIEKLAEILKIPIIEIENAFPVEPSMWPTKSQQLRGNGPIPVIGTASRHEFFLSFDLQPIDFLLFHGFQEMFSLKIIGDTFEPMAKNGDFIVIRKQNFAVLDEMALIEGMDKFEIRKAKTNDMKGIRGIVIATVRKL